MSNDPNQPNGTLGWPREGSSPAGPVLLEQAFDSGSLYALRAAVAAHTAAASHKPSKSRFQFSKKLGKLKCTDNL